MSDDIYSYIESKFGIKITDYQFKRDYIKEPLRKFKNHLLNEKPIKEDVEYLYITLNLTSNDIGKIINRCSDYISGYAKKLGIFKSKELIYESVENAVFRKYGKKNYFEGHDGYTNAMNALKEKYGYDNPIACPQFREKQINTLKEKYNITNPRFISHLINDYQNKDFINKINEKRYISKKKNKTFISSKEEDEIYNLLIQKYPNTIRQYCSEKYPFQCDFYIPEIDTYIEYQGHWKHGKEPYLETNIQKEKVKLWEEKSKEINFKGKNKKTYNDAIYTWTISDPLKRETAKKNNLNWIEFFNMKEFMEWYNQIL